VPKNRQALIRYHALDACLRRRGQRHTLAQLRQAATEALYEATGSAKDISVRTIQRDLQALRSDYGAPIEVEDKKYYRYAEPDFSITNSPLSREDLDTLHQALALLRQFEGFEQVGQLAELVQRVEDRISLRGQAVGPVIAFESAPAVPGRQFLTPLYEAIMAQDTVRLTYQPFHYPEPERHLLSPYFLKEYNSRWYVLGYDHGREGLRIFALDRTQAVDLSHHPYEPNHFIDPDTYFQHVIGVSLPPDRTVETIRLWVSPQQAPYVKTRPWHPSQRVVSEDETGMMVIFELIPNYELSAKILSFGAGVKVLGPEGLRETIMTHLQRATAGYEALS
jgi:predicted DNA-binding transcriptional regulator YafY